MGNIVTQEDIQKDITKWSKILSAPISDNDPITVFWRERKSEQPGHASLFQTFIRVIKSTGQDHQFPGLEKKYASVTRSTAMQQFKQHFLAFPNKLVVFHPNHLLAYYTFKPCYSSKPLYRGGSGDPAWHDYLGEWCSQQSADTIYFPLEATSFEKSDALYSSNPWVGKEVLDNLQPLAEFISREEAYNRIESDIYKSMRSEMVGLELLKPELGDIHVITMDAD